MERNFVADFADAPDRLSADQAFNNNSPVTNSNGENDRLVQFFTYPLHHRYRRFANIDATALEVSNSQPYRSQCPTARMSAAGQYAARFQGGDNLGGSANRDPGET